MALPAPLIYPGPLPKGALVRVNPTPALPIEPAAAPIWLDASEGVSLSDAGRVMAWLARDEAAWARPVPANVAGTGYQDQSLHFVAGENGGLVLSDAIADLSTLTIALVLSPNLPEARTLVSLQAAGSDDYIFLSLEGMTLRLAQRGSGTELTLKLNLDTRMPLMILCALSGGAARLSVNGGAVVTGRLAVESGPADLFIGCRNGKGGMKQKLGSFALSDVVVWPGQDLLAASAGSAAISTVTALWEDRCSRGL